MEYINIDVKIREDGKSLTSAEKSKKLFFSTQRSIFQP
jgi:hypothetical protein